MKEHDKFPSALITPTTIAHQGHDEDISRTDILNQGLVSEPEYIQLENYTKALYAKGSEMAKAQGLILVDTKYEFGNNKGKIYLIDEIHTPDSSRYFYAQGYNQRQENGIPQKQLSKEFVRQWLISEGFQGLEGQRIPEMTSEKINQISNRYIELYEKFTGSTFLKANTEKISLRIEDNILNWIKLNKQK
jgi:phosphoribosylaminoimidazole-succinocarboxamide synthase